jgi:hypothetical protein
MAKLLRGVKDQAVLEAVAAVIVERLRERTRGGSGAKTPGGNASALKELSDSYIKQRARDPRLSSETSPSTSNLTRHGGMLDSLDYTIAGNKITVSVVGEDNVKKAIYTHETRPWVNLTRADVTVIRDLVQKLAGIEIGKL